MLVLIVPLAGQRVRKRLARQMVRWLDAWLPVTADDTHEVQRLITATTELQRKISRRRMLRHATLVIGEAPGVPRLRGSVTPIHVAIGGAFPQVEDPGAVADAIAAFATSSRS